MDDDDVSVLVCFDFKLLLFIGLYIMIYMMSDSMERQVPR